MATYKSIIAYDGTHFHGFQRQAEERRTVQAALETALQRIGWRESSLMAAGRTDAGVHASGQVIAYTLDWQHAAADLSRALNANLPVDLAVWDTVQVPADFHPRFSALRRCYRYSLLIAEHRHPLRERYAWRIWPEPDLQRLQQVARWIEGTRDFRAFGRPPKEGGNSVRTVHRCAWQIQGDSLTCHLEANAFLYHMVRRLVAAMVAVERGRVSADDLRSLLEDPSLRWEGTLAPAAGLCLEAVIYDDQNLKCAG